MFDVQSLQQHYNMTTMQMMVVMISDDHNRQCGRMVSTMTIVVIVVEAKVTVVVAIVVVARLCHDHDGNSGSVRLFTGVHLEARHPPGDDVHLKMKRKKRKGV